MNKNLNLVEILKDCPIGTLLYSTIYGEVKFGGIIKGENHDECITFDAIISTKHGGKILSKFVTKEGLAYSNAAGECTLFPSKDQRDWSKFKINKSKFDPKTLKPFDKVLVRKGKFANWHTEWYSHKDNNRSDYPYICATNIGYNYCIPYNDETKHLVGTIKEPSEYYRHWED